jgi:hypothetical protein
VKTRSHSRLQTGLHASFSACMAVWYWVRGLGRIRAVAEKQRKLFNGKGSNGCNYRNADGGRVVCARKFEQSWGNGLVRRQEANEKFSEYVLRSIMDWWIGLLLPNLPIFQPSNLHHLPLFAGPASHASQQGPASLPTDRRRCRCRWAGVASAKSRRPHSYRSNTTASPTDSLSSLSPQQGFCLLTCP